MLPDVDAHERRLALGDRVVLVGAADHREPGAVVHQPRPARAELVDARLLELRLEVAEGPEGRVDRRGQVAVGLSAAVGGHGLPEERVVVVPTAVVAHGGRLVTERVEVLEDLLDRPVRPVGSLERGVGLVHVGLMVLVVVHAHGGLVDVRLERVVVVGEGWDLVGHRSSSVAVDPAARCSITRGHLGFAQP